MLGDGKSSNSDPFASSSFINFLDYKIKSIGQNDDLPISKPEIDTKEKHLRLINTYHARSQSNFTKDLKRDNSKNEE